MQPETEVGNVLPWQQQYELVVSDSKEMNLSRRARIELSNSPLLRTEGASLLRD